MLAAADVLKGKTCTAYPACSSEVTLAGGTMKDVSSTEVVVDGLLVSHSNGRKRFELGLRSWPTQLICSALEQTMTATLSPCGQRAAVAIVV